MDPRVKPGGDGLCYASPQWAGRKEGLAVAEKVLAAVRTGPSKTEIREFPMPDIAEDAALMKIDPYPWSAPLEDVKLKRQ